MGRLLTVLLLCGATAAEARFGKRSEPESKESQTHSATSAAAEETPSATSQSAKSWFLGFASPKACGYWSGAYVPWFGFGYRLFDEPQVLGGDQVQEEDQTTRLVAGVEAQVFSGGFTIAGSVGVEFGPFGLSASAGNISVKADDGSNGTDNLQQVTARVNYAFLTGRRGRWKAEVGADAIFAPDLIVVGPTVGTSGTVWIAGPLAAEGSVYWTFYPYDQLDLRLGAAVGLGPLGLRLGWRFQLLSDRGLVDSTVHTDIFTGPYTGLSLAL